MKNMRRILLLKADHQPSPDDLDAAARLARRTGSTLTFAELLPDGAAISDFFLGEHRRELERLLSPHAAGLEVSFELLSGAVGDALAALGKAHDLIVPAGGTARFLTDLLRTSPFPVWVNGTGAVPPRRILAAIDSEDPSPSKDQLSERVLEAALALAGDFDAEVEIASIWTPPGTVGRLTGRRGEEQSQRRRQDQAARRLERLVDRLVEAPAKRPPIHLAGGNPSELLAETASARSIDLIVAGHAGRDGLPAWLRANTAERLLQRVNCSLLALTSLAADESVRAA